MKQLILIPLILFGLMGGSTTKLQDKTLTTLDNLALYIQKKNPRLPAVDTYYIASALLVEGQSKRLSVIPSHRLCKANACSAHPQGGLVKVLTAMAEVESNFNPKAVGDSGSSLGILQVQSRYHGKVSINPWLQVRQAKSVLLSRGSIAKYNGRGRASRVYEAKVKRIQKRILI